MSEHLTRFGYATHLEAGLNARPISLFSAATMESQGRSQCARSARGRHSISLLFEAGTAGDLLEFYRIDKARVGAIRLTPFHNATVDVNALTLDH